jgi:hypothetical protein
MTCISNVCKTELAIVTKKILLKLSPYDLALRRKLKRTRVLHNKKLPGFLLRISTHKHTVRLTDRCVYDYLYSSHSADWSGGRHRLVRSCVSSSAASTAVDI